MAKPSPIIPDKLYFRIGEAAKLVGVEDYVLRFWETEFPTLRPTKSASGQRLYRRQDIEAMRRLKHLLHEEGYTIEGARKLLRARRNGQQQSALPFTPSVSEQRLKQLRAEIEALMALLNRKLK